MSLIKAAIVYKAHVPTDAIALHNHLAEKPFTPPMTLQMQSAGFVPPPGAETGFSLVAEFAGGLAFAVRIDEKIIPASVVRSRVDEEISQIKKNDGIKTIGKARRTEIRDQVMATLLATALVRTRAIITCFYHVERQHLMVSTTSKKLADICTSLLIQAVGSVKTETIHVSGVKHGLTTRLKHWLNVEAGEYSEPGNGEKSGFGEFQPVDNVALATSGEVRRKMAVSVGDLMINREGILEAIQRGFEVKSLGLATAAIAFRLTDDFQFKGITHQIDDESEYESAWGGEAAIEIGNLSQAIEQMTEMFAYKEQAQEAAQEGQDGEKEAA